MLIHPQNFKIQEIKLTKWKDKPTTIAGNFCIPLPVINKAGVKKISTFSENQNTCITKLIGTDIYEQSTQKTLL